MDTSATTLALAEQHRCWQLKARCVEFIAGYLDAVLETEGYKHLEESCPAVLSCSPTFSRLRVEVPTN